MHTNSFGSGTRTTIYTANHSKVGKILFFSCDKTCLPFSTFPPKVLLISKLHKIEDPLKQSGIIRSNSQREKFLCYSKRLTVAIGVFAGGCLKNPDKVTGICSKPPEEIGWILNTVFILKYWVVQA